MIRQITPDSNAQRRCAYRSGMAVVGSTNLNGLILQKALYTTSGLPVELDICDFALPVDQGEGVHSETLHVAVVQGDTHVILQEGELHGSNIRQLLRECTHYPDAC